MSDLEVELYSEKHERLYRIHLEVTADSWEPVEIWWIDSPFEALDPQGILMLNREECEMENWKDRFYLLTDLGGISANPHEAYCFYADLEESISHEVFSYRQEQEKDYDREEAYLELIGV